MRYRLLIQERGISDKIIDGITFESDDIQDVIKRLRIDLSMEILLRNEMFNQFLLGKKLTYVEDIIKNTDVDLVDWNSKGKDITKEEFLENEMYFALHW